MNTPSSAFKLAAPRLGLIQRALIVAAIVTIETLLVSGLIQAVPIDALTGAARTLRIFQHWGFRYLIAYAMCFAILVYLRSGGNFARVSATAVDAPVRLRWLLAHTLLLALFALLSTALYGAGPLPFGALAIAWHLCGCAAALSLFAALAPRRYWSDALKSAGSIPLYATLPAAAALLAYKASELLWAPAAAVTFQLVRWLLHPLLPALRGDASTLTLITDRVAIRVSEVCSGLEGVGLMLVFCSAWLWIYRREYIFPRALIIVPAAVLLIFVLNVVRIAVLVLIAEAGYEQVAIVGFHSQAGWIAFNLAALGVAIVAKRSSWLNRSAHEREELAGTDAIGAVAAGSNATAAYLMPLLAILASAMIVHALSAGFDLFYPLRLVSAAIALWVFRGSYRSLDWRFSWRGISVGIALFCMWAAFSRFLMAPAAMPQALAALPLPLRSAWIVCRAMAAILTVPIAEELAYRGYLMRRIVSREFDTLPLKAVSAMALVVSSIAFGLTHGAMWVAGIAAGLAYGLIAMKTGKIGEAVAAHATTNALVAMQVLLAGQWQLW